MDFGAAEELSSDGGRQFIANMFTDFLFKWGTHHRNSSVDYAQSNGRAEVAVKSAKRIIYDSTNADGSLNNDLAVKAILQYRNTPLQDCGLSPAQIVFHRQLRDSIPCHPSKYQLHPEWLALAKEREQSYHRQNDIIAEEYNRHTKVLRPLAVGTFVVIQGKDGKWKKQGQIVEQLDNRQYHVRVSGSGRITLRNRRFLRQCYHTKPRGTTLLIGSDNSIDTEGSSSLEQQSIPPETPSGDHHDGAGHSSNTDTTGRQGQVEQSVSPSKSHQQGQVMSPINARKRMPRALRNLQTYNNPGLKE